MRSLFTLLVAGAAAGLWVVGCGSDSTDTGPGGAAGANSAAQCVGTYADLTASAFDAKNSSSKACATDAPTVCSNDLTKIVGDCGKNCALTSGPDDAVQATCVVACLADKVSSPKPLTEACTTCYVDDVACARNNCYGECAFAPTSALCTKCRVDKGCAASFYGCSGVPVPTGFDLGSGGAGDELGAGAGGI